jgi:hypothetical protein
VVLNLLEVPNPTSFICAFTEFFLIVLSSTLTKTYRESGVCLNLSRSSETYIPNHLGSIEPKLRTTALSSFDFLLFIRFGFLRSIGVGNISSTQLIFMKIEPNNPAPHISIAKDMLQTFLSPLSLSPWTLLQHLFSDVYLLSF